MFSKRKKDKVAKKSNKCFSDIVKQQNIEQIILLNKHLPENGGCPYNRIKKQMLNEFCTSYTINVSL